MVQRYILVNLLRNVNSFCSICSNFLDQNIHATSVQDEDSVLKKFKYDHFLNYFFAFGGSESKLVDVTVQ